MFTMNVDLLSIINKTVKEIPLDCEAAFETEDYSIQWKLSGVVFDNNGRIEVKATANACVSGRCARCTKDVKRTIFIDISEEVGKDEVVLDGTVLDIDSIVKNNIVVELPIRFLCKEDCKGICDICGADLNITECNCSHERFDERLSVLAQLLDCGNEPD